MLQFTTHIDLQSKFKMSFLKNEDKWFLFIVLVIYLSVAFARFW